MRTLLLFTALTGFCCMNAMAADAKAGKETYDKSCKSCHGADGTPNPGMVKMLKVEMTDLKATTMSEADIKKIVTEGKGKMKPVTSVTGPPWITSRPTSKA